MIIRRKYTKNFTILSREVLHDRRLSPEALGVLCYLRGLPDDWTVSQEHLRERFNAGKHKIQGIVRELIATGWMVRQTARTAGRGTFAGSDYIVNDEPSESAAAASPQLDFQATAQAVPPQPDLPAPEKPEPDEPAPENPAAYLESNLTKDSSPLNPPTGGGHRARKLLRGNGVAAPVAAPPAANRPPAAVLEPASAERFERLVRAFPEEARGHTREDRAREIWAGMPAEEQLLAIGAAASYRAGLAKSGLQAKGLHGWLAQRRWVNFRPVQAAGATPAPPASGPGRIFVREGSPEWQAWTAHYRAAGRPMPTPIRFDSERADGWRFPSAMPPAADSAQSA